MHVQRRLVFKKHLLRAEIRLKPEALNVPSRVAIFLKGAGILLPVAPDKAVAEVSIEETYRRGWLLGSKNGRANPLMDLQVVGASSYIFAYLSGCLTHELTN